MSDNERGTRVFTRALAILVVIAGFAATQQIELAKVDALVIVGVIVAAVVLTVAVVTIVRTPTDEKALLLSSAEAGVFAAGALAIFGIFRTVLPTSTSFQTDPILGLGLVALLLVLWVATQDGSLRRSIGLARGAPSGSPPPPPDGPGGPGAAGGGSGGGEQGTGAATGTPSAMPSLNVLQATVAIAVVIVYGAMLYGLWTAAGANVDDKPWSRLVELKSGIEQVAFGALGALLGFAVQSRATTAAVADAEKARDEADQSQKAKDQAVQVASAAVSVASGEPAPPSAGLESFGGDQTTQLAVLKERLRQLEGG